MKDIDYADYSARVSEARTQADADRLVNALQPLAATDEDAQTLLDSLAQHMAIVDPTR